MAAGSMAAVGTAAVGTVAVGTAGVGGLGSTRGAGAGELPIARKAPAGVVAASAATTCAGAIHGPPADRSRSSAPAGAEGAAAAANRGDLGLETTRA